MLDSSWKLTSWLSFFDYLSTSSFYIFYIIDRNLFFHCFLFSLYYLFISLSSLSNLCSRLWNNCFRWSESILIMSPTSLFNSSIIILLLAYIYLILFSLRPHWVWNCNSLSFSIYFVLPIMINWVSSYR